MKGTFIVFEGLDGSGKGTMITRSVDYLFNHFKEFDRLLLTREPTFSATGRQIRNILKKDLDPMSKAKVLLNLYLEDRKEHVEKVIKPAIQQGLIVLCDRFKYSTLAYQQTQGIPFENIHSMHARILVPDLTLILDVPADVAMDRIARDRDSVEKFEQSAFLEELRNNYLALPKQLPDENIVVIDADRPKDEVFASVRRELKKVLDKSKATAKVKS